MSAQQFVLEVLHREQERPDQDRYQQHEQDHVTPRVKAADRRRQHRSTRFTSEMCRRITRRE
jgi:hypothetical protein